MKRKIGRAVSSGPDSVFLRTPTSRRPPIMKSIQVYDPAMCCATGICGPDIDPDLVNFAGMLAQLSRHAISIERFNLAQQPAAFAANPGVKILLQAGGTAVLPLIFWDGELKLKGRYPIREERSAWICEAITGKEKEA